VRENGTKLMFSFNISLTKKSVFVDRCMNKFKMETMISHLMTVNDGNSDQIFNGIWE
jgi:hypothetical protein